MTTDNVIECGSFDDKIKDISDYLKTNVLEQTKKKKSELLNQAQEEKKKIIEAAEKRAADIEVTDVDMPVRMSGQRLHKAGSFLRRLAVEAIHHASVF